MILHPYTYIINSALFKNLTLLIILLFSCTGFSQITVSGTPVAQTCPGNGSITFSAQNIDTSYPLAFRLYLLPDLTNPISENSNTAVQGLIAGTYIVTAVQNIDGNIVSGNSNEIIIENLYTSPDFSLTSTNTQCGSDGTITATQTQGNILTYELTGPVNRQPQQSGVFNNLPAGIYTVKVTDECGTVIPHTITLFSDIPALLISPPGFPDIELPACNLITISNNVTPATNMPLAYPFTVIITLYPPQGGAPVNYSQIVTDGAENSFSVTQVVPFYYDTDYYYTIAITDPCGAVYTLPNNLIRQKLTVTADIADAGCGGKYITVSPSKFVGPYTVNFTSPSNFNPVLFNNEHPGPFDSTGVQYGEYGDPVPFGAYNFSVTDACGHTAIGTLELEYIEPVPLINIVNTSCEENLGEVTIFIAGYIIETGQIVATTSPGYTLPLPTDVSSFINEDAELEVTGLPPGTYTFTVTDNCGNEYTDLIAVVPDFASSANAVVRPGCEPGTTAVSLTGNSPLTSVKITVAPAGFDQVAMPLPYDVSANISEAGIFYNEGLPPGAYTFKVTNECGATLTVNATLVPYTVTANTIEIIRHCGSFDVSFNHTSNSASFLSYWLQKEISPGQWGHPVTGVLYPDNTVPNENNSMPASINTFIYSITQIGKYRIIKRFRSFSNSGLKECIDVLHEFEFNDDLQIGNPINLTCTGDLYNIKIIATGAEPLTYKITKKNNEPFEIDNGTNNIFLNLESAVYTVEVSDPCGHTVPRTFNVADLPSLVNAANPTPLVICDTDSDGTELFDLSTKNEEILNNQDPALYQLTYYATQEDAELGINILPFEYTTAPVTIFARVQYDTNVNCYVTVPLELKLYASPEVNLAEVTFICSGSSVTLYAGAGFSSYTWSTGAVTPTITVTEGGIYTVKVTNVNNCEATAAITVIPSELPVIDNIVTTDWTDNNNIITINTIESLYSADFEYSINGTSYQDSNQFTNLTPGLYTVYVRDRYNCGIVQQDVYLLNYPKYFTPNGDTYNEYWHIPYSASEPDMLIYIYDRYGKLITGFTPNSPGWDGTLNGAHLPATDYWFVIQRSNGLIHKGHFAMIR